MDIEAIQEFVKQLPGVTEDIKWDHLLCFLVGGKMFAVVDLNDFPLSISFKTTEERFAELVGQSHFSAAPYLGKSHWLLLSDLNALSKSVLMDHLVVAHKLIGSKLPAKIKKDLGLN
jgi:predicted DNA-binding protein (MmcQ/YjbR family)